MLVPPAPIYDFKSFETLEHVAFAINAAIALAFILTHLRRPKALFLFVAFVAAVTYVSVFKTFGFWRHIGLNVLALFFAMWVGHHEEDSNGLQRERLLRPLAALAKDPARRVFSRALTATLCLATAVSCWAAYYPCKDDVQNPYSFAPAMARYLLDHRLETAPIAASYEAEAVLPYSARLLVGWVAAVGIGS